jgi:site-specific DNA recombinase
VYCRISRDRRGEFLGVERQRADCLALVEACGWSPAAEFVDNDISASRYTRKVRPAYREMLGAVRDGRVSRIVVFATSRLYRRPVELEALIELAEEGRVEIVTASRSGSHELDLSTRDGRLNARILVAVDAAEVEAMSDRISREKEQAAVDGRPGGGGRPFGYAADRVTIVDPEAAVIREAVRRVLAGESVRSVLRDLDSRGVMTPHGRRWRQSTLRRMLLHPRLAGLREHRGAVVGPACWAPIISKADHDRLRAVLGDPEPRGKRPPRTSLLSGLLYCGRCGAKLSARPEANGTRRYSCHPSNLGCGRLAVYAEPLESHIAGAVLVALADGLGQEQSEDDGQAADLAAIEQDEAQLTELAEAYSERAITMAEWLAARRLIEERIKAARQRCRERTKAKPVVEAVSDLTRLADEWSSLSVERRLAIISAVIDRIVVNPARPGAGTFEPSRLDVTWRR